MRRRAAALLLGLAALAPGAAAAAPALTVCLEAAVPPLSRQAGGGSGFDLAVARAVAARLGRPLALQWFETETDPDSSPARQVNALLADGRCDLVGGYPLTERSLAPPASERGRLPDFAGARPEDRRRWVTLGRLVPTHPYRRDTLALVTGPAAGELEIRQLAELRGRRLGVEERTFADAILTAYQDGLLLDTVVHAPAGAALFEALERGETEAALVETHRFDAWRAAHPQTPLRLAAYRHPIGFNAGFVALSTAAPLVEAVDAALDRLREEGGLPRLAAMAGLTYAPPQPPGIGAPIRRAMLRED
ncbi:substrate-binding periplasmic protein [Roseicella frigidaeris]|uniref:substrate-binding periplasmic protein n=1 Tax=Roseicella frigidaeris TaxID=2230885 RepID=UPI000F0B53E4|nr:transporter substrate-binding domain-containing protein [Roseicella frigidaeris]